MTTAALSIDQLGTETIELPAKVAEGLKAEARARRTSTSKLLEQVLEDLADARESQKRLREIETGKVKAVAWDDARKRLLAAS